MALTRSDGGDVAPARRRLSTTPVRIVLVGAACTVLAILASRAFDDLVWPLLLVAPIVTAAGLVGRHQRWLRRAAILLAGVVLATVVAGVLAEAGLGDLVGGPFTGLTRLLTTEWPSPRDPRIVVAVALLLAVVTAIAVDLAGRPHLNLAPLVVVAIGFTGAMAVAAPVRPDVATVVALAALALIVAMFRPGEDARTRVRTLLADRPLLGALAGIALAGAVTAGIVAWTDRADPRSTQEAEATLALLDPVEATVALREADPPIDLFRVTDRSTLIGPTLPARWRVAALDDYDGQRWTPGLTLRPIGSRLGLPSAPRPDVAPPIEFDVELLTDDIDLVPIPGRPLAVETGAMGVETDLDRTVVRLTDAPRPGLTIRASAEAAPGPATARVSTIATRQVDEIASGFTDLARTIAGAGTVLEQLREIEQTMHDEWLLDRAAPGGGQQLKLIERFVADTRYGTEEQFVTAFVLMARSLGVQARVATGFVVPPGEFGTPLALRSTHAAVWPEVALAEGGWLAFDPAPPQETPESDSPPPPPSAQSPAAPQPPIAPPTERADDEEQEIVDQQSDTTRWSAVRAWLARIGVAGGLAVLPFALAAGTVLGIKWARRRRRLNASDPARRITGVWANTTDSLVDAGLTIGPAWTNARIAERGQDVAPTLPHEVRRLAATASAITFSESGGVWAPVEDAIAVARAVDEAIRSGRTRWQRLRWRLSLRSLRRPTRSPVSA